MPKSKRDKVVSLSKVKRKTKAEKAALVEQLQEAANQYLYVYLFEVQNMKNEALKKVRSHWQGKGRFFMGKNKLMAYALGKEPSSELKPNIYQLTQRITGNACGLFFTDAKPVEVINYFAEFEEPHYAQSGFVATEDFGLVAGPLVDQPFSIETQLRALGLPTRLKDGVVVLESDVSVCKVGDVLTPEQCKVLKLFGQEMAVFKIKINCVHAGSAVTDLTNPTAQAMQAAAGAAGAAAAAGAGAAASAFAGLSGAGADEKAAAKKPALSMSGAGAAGGATAIPAAGSAAQMGMQFMLDDGTEVLEWNDGSAAAGAGAGAAKKKGGKKKAASAAAAAGDAAAAAGMEDDAPAAKPARGRGRGAKLSANAVSLKDQAQKALSQPLPFAFPGADVGSAAVAAAPKALDMKLEKPRARSKTPTKAAAAKGKSAAKKKVNDDGMGTGKMKAAKPKRITPMLG